MWKSVGACLFYAVMSMTLSLVNKSLMTVYSYKQPLFILLVQFISNIIILPICFILLPTHYKKLLGFSDLKASDSAQLFLPSFVFLLNITAGVYALSRVNIPMFLAIRRLNALVVYSSDVVIYKKPIIALEFVGIVLISLGAVMAGLSDLTADYLGYALAMLNNILTTAHLQLSKQSSVTNPRLTAFNQTLYNAVNGIPMLLMLCFYNSEFEVFSLLEKSFNFYTVLFFTSILGILLSISTALCNLVNSPIATTITGNMKDLFLTVVGLFIFGDVIVTTPLLTGLGLSLLGATLFSASKLQSTLSKTR
mmetsp:Transcript_6822/g.12335  ORF Transcript_6822/g.12335 Transcript_6822/m.12335 type:complete len:308 (+) Transcript_6822:2195-3118(+)|eukprot:CAMPEP_0204908248 /NCGR_PEP_ID=MMETSP1397-20131031/7227_1 /ASSEMBLY_ACC=CAM_ASM_000891 /TAXON_ID=49980 /ORGANISM="Climacostomum Climacostomum virens, Strain Stock W-24" /LENGTH=307 /DNA_ID=CAMNT_0052077689 /DNA_START=94 /DNA_END=1020 /DNA_ORIENTATION=+